MTNHEKTIAIKIGQLNGQIMSLLCLYPPFQKRVKRLRKRCKIPPQGFLRTRTNQKLLSWRRKRGLSTAIWSHLDYIKPERQFYRPLDKDFQEVLSPPIGSAAETWVQNNDALVGRFNLAEHFRLNIERYVLLNEITAPMVNHQIKIEFKHNYTWQKSIPLKVFGEITVEEHHLIQSIINKKINSAPEKARLNLRRNLPRDLEIFDKVKSRTGKETWNTYRELAAHIKAFDIEDLRALDEGKQRDIIKVVLPRIRAIQRDLFEKSNR